MKTTTTKSTKGWSQSKLIDLLTIVRGVSYKKEHATDKPTPGHVPILRATNIQNGLVFEDFVYVPESYVSEEQFLRRGDIVIAASSGSRHIVGKAAQLTTDWRGSFGTFCFGLRPKPGVNPGYLAWFLQTSEYRQQVSELSAGVNINNLRAKHIEEIPIPVAPPDEQPRIVAEIEKQFTRLEAGVTALRRVQANLKRYRAAVLKAACEGRLVPTEAELAKKGNRKSKFETGAELLARILTERRQNWHGRGKYKEPVGSTAANLPELPEGWACASLGEICYRITDGTHLKPTYMEKGMPFLSVKNVRPFRLYDTDIKFISAEQHADYVKRCRPEKGDILYTKVGATFGYAAINTLDYDFSIYVSLALLKYPQHLIESKYIEMCMNSPVIYSQAQKRIKGIGRPDLHLEEIRDFYFPLPPLAEQTRIVAEVERRLSVIDEMEKVVLTNLARSQCLRQSILQKAFQGDLLKRSLCAKHP